MKEEQFSVVREREVSPTFWPTLCWSKISLILLVIIFVSNSLVRAAISYRLGEAEKRRIWDCNPRLKDHLPPEVGGNPGGLIPSIFLWAAMGSRRLDPGDRGWDRFGSVPNLRVDGSRGLSNGGLMRFSCNLFKGLLGGMPAKFCNQIKLIENATAAELQVSF